MAIKKISTAKLREMIETELTALSEQVDHESIRDVVTAAQKLLSAVETFKASATPAAINSVTPHIDHIEKVLEDMLNTPGSYVAKQSSYKKVSLKPVK
jgi:hypothetical protein